MEMSTTASSSVAEKENTLSLQPPTTHLYVEDQRQSREKVSSLPEFVEGFAIVKTNLEDEIATIKNEILALKKEVDDLRKTARSHRVKISCNLL
ncbi:hypothetical protein LXL04_033004 [Taraxacum kok-saghyz]